METIRKSLEGLGFYALEVNINLLLLDNGTMSPYQIAKKGDISRCILQPQSVTKCKEKM